MGRKRLLATSLWALSGGESCAEIPPFPVYHEAPPGDPAYGIREPGTAGVRTYGKYPNLIMGIDCYQDEDQTCFAACTQHCSSKIDKITDLYVDCINKVPRHCKIFVTGVDAYDFYEKQTVREAAEWPFEFPKARVSTILYDLPDDGLLSDFLNNKTRQPEKFYTHMHFGVVTKSDQSGRPSCPLNELWTFWRFEKPDDSSNDDNEGGDDVTDDDEYPPDPVGPEEWRYGDIEDYTTGDEKKLSDLHPLYISYNVTRSGHYGYRLYPTIRSDWKAWAETAIMFDFEFPYNELRNYNPYKLRTLEIGEPNRDATSQEGGDQSEEDSPFLTGDANGAYACFEVFEGGYLYRLAFQWKVDTYGRATDPTSVFGAPLPLADPVCSEEVNCTACLGLEECTWCMTAAGPVCRRDCGDANVGFKIASCKAGAPALRAPTAAALLVVALAAALTAGL